MSTIEFVYLDNCYVKRTDGLTKYKKITLNDLLELLEHNDFADKIKQIRELKDSSARDRLKKELPCFTIHATYNLDGETIANDIISLDIDDLSTTDLEFFASQFEYDKKLLLAFKSASGRGLRLLYRYNVKQIKLLDAYNLALEHFYTFYDKDFNVKPCNTFDLMRLCFISQDDNYYLNEQCEVFDIKQIVDEFNNIENNAAKDVFLSLLKYEQFVEGNRNNFIFKLACRCNEAGIELSELIKLIETLFASDRIERAKAITTAKGVYERKKDDFGKNKKYKDINNKKGTNDNKEQVLTPSIYMEFLKNNGYFALRIDKANDIKILAQKIEENKFKRINRTDIINELQKFLQINNYNVANSLNKSFLAESHLYDFLETIDCDLKIHKEVTIFENTAIDINLNVVYPDFLYLYDDDKNDKNRINTVIRHNFKINYYIKSEFESFIENVSRNEKGELDNKRKKQLMWLIGYLMRREYLVDTKCVILTDAGSLQEAKGGTGKSLIAKALEIVRNCTYISGKEFLETSRFKMAEYKDGSDIIIIDDVNVNFFFEKLFNIITEQLTIERKFQNPYKIPATSGYKILLTTNKMIKLNDVSSKRRVYVYELSNYYNENYQPADDENVGILFENWTNEQWDAFYLFMMQCWNYSAASRAENLDITNDIPAEKKAILLAEDSNLTDIVYDTNIMRELDDKYLTSTEVMQVIERYFLDITKNMKNKKYIVQNLYKIYELLGYDVEFPTVNERRNGRVGRFYKVKFNSSNINNNVNNNAADSSVNDIDSSVNEFEKTNELPF